MERKYKVLFLCVGASGHLNPTLCFANELGKNNNVHVVFFGNAEHRKKIESSNIEFREWKLEFFEVDDDIKAMRKNLPLDKIFNSYMKGTAAIMDKVINTIEGEKIDLVIYDVGTMHAFWINDKLESRYKRGISKFKPPEFMLFSPSFLSADDIYPNKAERVFFPRPSFSIGLIFKMIILAVNYTYFCWKHGVRMINPIKLIKAKPDKISICCVIPELQPRSYLFPKSAKFVGNCASEEVRLAKSLEEPLNSFLKPFEPINPLPLLDLQVKQENLPSNYDNIKLVYASFGTLYNHDIDSLKLIIEAVKQLNNECKKPKIRLLMSTGERSLARLQQQIDNKQLEVPDNVLMMSRVPQLDVLKRASLFITHAGQNSTSESIHYGVPMLCIPIFGDQPLVAYRVADELGLGKRLSLDDIDATKIKNAITDILDDKSYLERTILFSKISKKYDGSVEASNVVIKYLQDRNDRLRLKDHTT